MTDEDLLASAPDKPTLYRKFIRPMHMYPGFNYDPKTEPVEEEEIWYPEEERERLESIYGYLNGHFSALVFDEKYEPYFGNEVKQNE